MAKPHFVSGQIVAAIILSSGIGASAATAASLGVVVGNASANGTPIYAALCQGGIERENCSFGERRYATGPEVRFDFTNVPAGRYAVVVFQDLNNSGTLERSKLGIPLEPYALSNNAGRKGRPTFEQAAIDVREGTRDIRLELRAPKAAAE